MVKGAFWFPFVIFIYMKYPVTYIYFLHNGDNVPFYVGKSINVKLHRSYQHKKTFGKNTMLEIIDKVPTDEWLFWESYWIEQFKSWGFKLKNKNNGGGGSITLSDEVKFVKSEKMKKFWETKPSRKSHKRIRDNNTGIIYNTIKDLLKSLDKGGHYNMIYKQIGDNKQYSYC